MSLVSVNHPVSDSDLTVALHPLVLLTISDYITRHAFRYPHRPIVGALLGQQSGRTITLEHAFECQTSEFPSSSEIRLAESWFQDRLQQYKDVHQAPALELVGWFTTTPVTGPEKEHLPIHQQFLQGYNETSVLLAFHPVKLIEATEESERGKLPLTIYESVFEPAGELSGGVEAMDLDSAEGGPENGGSGLRFRELPYSIETGEAEMIGVVSVATGRDNTTAIEEAVPTTPTTKTASKGKGKVQKSQARATGNNPESIIPTDDSKASEDVLPPEDEEVIRSLTARINAIRMLHTRITLLTSYLSSLPPSYLTDASLTTTSRIPPRQSHPHAADSHTQLQPQPHILLRSISALLTRFPLLHPPPLSITPPNHSHASASTPLPTTTPAHPTTVPYPQLTLPLQTDNSLISLLNLLVASTEDVKGIGREYTSWKEAKDEVARKEADRTRAGITIRGYMGGSRVGRGPGGAGPETGTIRGMGMGMGAGMGSRPSLMEAEMGMQSEAGPVEMDV